MNQGRNTEPQRILIVKLSALGDVTMTLPFLKALRSRYPRANLCWLVEEAASGLLQGHPDLNEVVVAPRREITQSLKKGRLKKALSLFGQTARRLQAGRFDWAVDLQGLFKSAVWTYLSRAPRRIGFARAREGASWALNDRLPPYDPNRHALRRYLDVAGYLGAESFFAPEKPYFPAYPEAALLADKLLSPRGSEWVALNPGAKWPSKRWPPVYWQILAGDLIRQGLRVMITGGPEDRDLAEFIRAGRPAVMNLCGGTDLKTLAEIYRRCRLMITGDTGPMHLAAAAGTAVLALFGPTDPGRTGPLGPNTRVLTAGLACLKCLKRVCPLGTQACLAQLTPAEIRAIIIENYLN